MSYSHPERTARERLGAKECVRVLLAVLALAFLGVWTRLDPPATEPEAGPAAALRLARFVEPELAVGAPPFARAPLPDGIGAAMVGRAGLDPVGADLLLAVLGGFLGGLAVWAFLRGLCGRPLAAFAATAILMMQPWRTTLVGDPATSWLLGPALALGGLTWIVRGGGIRAGLLAGAGLALCGWTSLSQLFTISVGGILLALAHLPLMRRPFPSGEPVPARRATAAFGCAALLAAAALVPALLRGLPERAPLDGAAAGWLGSDGAFQLLGVSLSPEGHHFYWPVLIGWLVAGVLVWVALYVRDPRLRPWWILLAISYLLLQGSHLRVLGVEFPQVVMPHAWLAGLPGYGLMSGPAAWLPLFGLALAAILALGLREWQVQHGRTATFLLAAFTALELRPEPLDAAVASAPSLQAILAAEEDGALLDLPLDPTNAAALLAAHEHGRPLIFGEYLLGAQAGASDAPAGLVEFLLPEPGDPTDAGAALDAVPAAERERWRAWLEQDAGMRWAVLRHPSEGRGVRPLDRRITWMQRLKRELTPWSFNGWLHEEREAASLAGGGAASAAAARSARARALLESWYGPADARLGSAQVLAWTAAPGGGRAVEAAAREPSAAVPAAAPR